MAPSLLAADEFQLSQMGKRILVHESVELVERDLN